MNLFNYYADLRDEILQIITGVENSSHSLFWDNTTPNYITQGRLKRIHEKYLSAAKEFGLLMVTRHAYCPNENHKDYLISNKYGLDISYQDKGYIWGGGQFFQGMRSCICPCLGTYKTTEHYVIDDIIYEKKADVEVCKGLEVILGDISDAIDCAGDKKTRAAIRENLLRAVLRINDELLPEPMDTYIKNHRP